MVIQYEKSYFLQLSQWPHPVLHPASWQNTGANSGRIWTSHDNRVPSVNAKACRDTPRPKFATSEVKGNADRQRHSVGREPFDN
ncbi:hypothetical protein [Hallella colorans]|uniref:hypothetical protein n=1 Tax=Hallella colorans TaxID=1703337 RepID=UPI0023F1AE29|nr:hypothetical protein [Hallella colorans]